VPRGRSAAQEDVNALLVERARTGKNVVRLKGVFGRGFEELQYLHQAGVPVRVIPGPSSSISVPALADIPLTHRDLVHEFAVVSGHIPPDHPDSLVDWEALGRLHGTLVLLMAVKNAGAIADALLAAGRPADTADRSHYPRRACPDPRRRGHPAAGAHRHRRCRRDAAEPRGRPDREGVVDNHHETAGSLPPCDGMRKPVKFRHGRATVKPPPPGGRQVRPSPSRRSND
jgi:Uroporphyrinogen-III methylase